MYKKITTIEEHSDVSENHTPKPVLARNGSIKKYAPCIRVDIPLLIRLLEFAREDASSDTDLHVLATNMVELSEEGRVLTMQDYTKLLEGTAPKTA